MTAKRSALGKTLRICSSTRSEPAYSKRKSWTNAIFILPQEIICLKFFGDGGIQEFSVIFALLFQQHEHAPGECWKHPGNRPCQDGRKWVKVCPTKFPQTIPAWKDFLQETQKITPGKPTYVSRIYLDAGRLLPESE